MSDYKVGLDIKSANPLQSKRQFDYSKLEDIVAELAPCAAFFAIGVLFTLVIK